MRTVWTHLVGEKLGSESLAHHLIDEIRIENAGLFFFRHSEYSAAAASCSLRQQQGETVDDGSEREKKKSPKDHGVGWMYVGY